MTSRPGADPTSVDLAVDGGQTGLRMAVATPAAAGTGAVPALGPPADVPGFSWTSGEDPVESQVEAVERAWTALGRPGPVGSVACGMSGAPSADAERERLGRGLLARLGARRALVTGDDVTTHAGALAGRPGVVLAAGTGVICTAVDEQGHSVRLDGWGYLLGDAGGGSWLGREGLRAALAAVDGRAPRTVLADRAVDRFGELRAFVHRILAAPTMVREIASFARDVVEAAAAGDPVAADLGRRAAAELAATAAATVHRGFPGAAPGSVALTWTGSVLRGSDVLRAPFLAGLAEQAPAARVREPVGGGLEGAAVLATTAGTAHHALAREVTA